MKKIKLTVITIITILISLLPAIYLYKPRPIAKTTTIEVSGNNVVFKGPDIKEKKWIFIKKISKE